MLLDADIVREVLTEPPVVVTTTTTTTATATADPPRYTKGILGPVLTETLGDGLITLEGADWSRHRRIVQPAFQTRPLRERLGECVPRRTMEVVRAWRIAGPDRSIDLASHMSALTLDVIGDVAFSHEFGGVEKIREWAAASASSAAAGRRGSGDENENENDEQEQEQEQELAELDDPLIRAMSVVFKPNFRVIFAVVFRLYSLNWLLNPKSRQTRMLLNEAVDDIIADAREKEQKRRRRAQARTTTTPSKEGSEKDESSSSSSSSYVSKPPSPSPSPSATAAAAAAAGGGGPKLKGKSLLELLFDAEEGDVGGRNSLDHEELRAECNTFILAGHETTSTWCYWALYALSKHPDVQEKVYDEIRRVDVVNGEKEDDDEDDDDEEEDEETLSLESIERLEYFDAFLKEVLRLYPPVGMIFRRTAVTLTLGGYTIPPDTRCMIPIHVLHRHPRYWGDDPLTFRPERWLIAKKYGGKKKEEGAPSTHKFAYLPFSRGPRNCVGQRFAAMEAKVIIANLAKHFRFELSPECRGVDIQFATTITVKAKPAIKVLAKSRAAQ